MDEYAIISDVHGNLWALESVLADAKRRGLENIINLGDSLYGPLKPKETANLLMHLPITNVLGNHDQVLLEKRDFISPTLEYTLKSLNSEIYEWLESIPVITTIFDQLFLCHGTPNNINEYLLENTSMQGNSLKEPSEIQSQLTNVKQIIILCGHSHTPRTILLPDGKMVINPGSVGEPSYFGTSPVNHRVIKGSPHAHYAGISKSETGWTVEHIDVPYDWEAAAKLARQNGRNDWASWLMSGWA